MRYFLNGEDLGASFVEFSVAASGLFPAISLNVRQSVRVNFGQFKFVHPPDEVDGKAYFPVMHAFQLPREDKLPAVTVDDAATVDSDSEHILTEENDKEFPQALFGSSTYEGSLNSLVSFFRNIFNHYCEV